MNRTTTLNRRLLAFVSRRYPDDPDTVRRVLLLTSLNALVALYCVFFTTYYSVLGLYIGTLINLYGLGSVGVAFLGIFQWKKVDWVGHFFCGTTLVYFSISMWFSEGVHSPFVHWLIIAPVTSSFLLGRKETIVWSVAVLVLMLLFFLLDDWVPPAHPQFFLANENLVTMFSYLGFFFFCLAIIFILEKNKSDLGLLQRLREAERQGALFAIQEWIQGQERERARIARELHDGLNGRLTAVRLLHQASGAGEEGQSGLFDSLEDIGLEISALSRSFSSHELRDFGLEKAIFNQVEELVRRAGTQVEFIPFGLEKPRPENWDLLIYRIVQECLEQSSQTAGATSVTVQVLQLEEVLRILVEDDGKGQPEEETGYWSAWAYQEISNRVEVLGGELLIDYSPGRGLTIIVEIPMRHG